ASFSLNSGLTFSSSTAAGVVTNTTLQNAQITGVSFGNNGLANSLEINADNGVINYKSYYLTYAIFSNKQICNQLDSDGDGIADIIDLDDDNDGILDNVECNTYPKKILFAGSAEDFNGMRTNLYNEFDTYKTNGAVITQSNIIENASPPAGFYDGYDMVIFGGAALNTINQAHWDALKNSILNKTSKSYIIQSDNCCNVTNKNNLITLLNTVNGTNYALNASKTGVDEILQKNNSNTYASVFTANTLTGSDYYGVTGVSTNDVLYYSTVTNFTSTAFAGIKQLPNTQDRNRFLAWFVDGSFSVNRLYTSNAGLIAPPFYDAFSLSAPSSECDTDGDGILNQLDLDSDGDGCSDAKEARVTGTLTSGTVVNLVNNNAGAGTATSTTANFANSIAVGPYGTNGYANSLETSLETGVGNYTSTYSTYAIDKTKELCTDSDGDGVPDALDLDDDNDGVLDDTENICQYIFLETFGATLPYPTLPTSNVLITSSEGAVYNAVPTHAAGYWFAGRLDNTPDDVNGNMLMGYNIASTKIVYTKTITGLTVGQQYEFSAYIANPLTSLGTSSNLTLQLKNASNTIFNTLNTGNILQGNFNWVKYSMVVSAPSNSVTFEIQTNSFGNNNTGEDFVLDDIGVKKIGCEDIDGDGIPNRLDLDSDGDGCPDAVESGVNGVLTSGTIINTTADANSGVYSTTGVAKSIAAGSYGANGLADGVETSVDAGTITYTNNYLRYATDKNINYCTDSDGDGIPDAIDIDDDNDGIRDYIEQGSCPAITSTGLTFTGSTNAVKFSGNAISAASTTNGAWQTAYSNQSLTLPIHLEFKDNGNAGYTMFGLLPILGTKTLANYTDDAYKIYLNTTSVQGYLPNTGVLPSLGYPANSNLVIGDLWQMDIDIFGFVTITRNGVAYKSFQGVNSNYNVAISSYNDALNSPRILSDVLINAKSITLSGTTSLCTELDTDGDNIPNRLDLDSDGDLCSDAVESGVTASLNTAKTIANAPYGTNGLANNAETTTDNGITSYNPTYYFAINSSIKGCTDTDGDGIPDVFDLDDDNDGVLDVVEAGTCVDLSSSNITFTGGLTSLTKTSSTIAGISASGWKTNYSDQAFVLPIHLEFRSPQLVNSSMFGLIPSIAGKTPNAYSDDAYKIYYAATAVYGYLPSSGLKPTSWSPSSNTGVTSQTQTFGELWQMDID
ncbi:MAG: hypothetical protein EBZ95_13015, partial [Chitinophagia bacterium]|nr:hypothetical protein [Chitinophagia bacterium]